MCLQWTEELRRLAPNVPTVLVGTQTDLRGSAEYVATLRSRGDNIVSSLDAHNKAKQLYVWFLFLHTHTLMYIYAQAAVNAAL